MATTSLWHIKGRLGDLIDYVKNPEKTAPKGTGDFFNVFSYIQSPQKTADGSFVTAINCLKQTALRQMILTKQRTKLQNKTRRAPPAEKERLRAEKRAVTEKNTVCRKKLNLNVSVRNALSKFRTRWI